MKKKQIGIIAGIVVFVVFIVGIYFVYDKLKEDYKPDNLAQQTTQGEASQSGDEDKNKFSMPDFTVTDMNGKAVKLSDFRGKPVVMNLWATWCGFCVKEMPDFEKVYKEEPDVQFLMVNLTGGGETLEGAKKFIAKNGFTFPVFFDTEGEVQYNYDTSSVPVTFFIDKEGNLATYARGMIDEATLRKGIEIIK